MKRRKKTFCCTWNEKKTKRKRRTEKYGKTQIGGRRTNCFITQNTRNRRKTKRKKTHPPKNPIAKKKYKYRCFAN